MDAIAMIVSSNNPKAMGSSGEIGLYQISPIALKHFNTAAGDSFNRVSKNELLQAHTNHMVAGWYFNWIYDRTWTVKDTIIAWNWGIGNWRKWNKNKEHYKISPPDNFLPQVTQDYLKKYEKITGKKL